MRSAGATGDEQEALAWPSALKGEVENVQMGLQAAFTILESITCPSLPAPSKGLRMEASTLVRDLHWTPLEGPGMYVYDPLISGPPKTHPLA